MARTRLMMAVSTLVLMCGSVQAADFAPPPADDWSGLYLGGHAGYLWGDVDADGDDADIKGFVWGALAGYNLQSDNIVFGIEADFGISDADGFDFSSADLSYDLNSNGHLRGRLGLDMDMFMPFIAAGVAAGNFEVTEQTASSGDEKTLWGFTVGGGIDVAVGENVVIRAEYLYDDYGSKDFDVYSGVDVGFDTHTIRGALIWQFN